MGNILMKIQGTTSKINATRVHISLGLSPGLAACSKQLRVLRQAGRKIKKKNPLQAYILKLALVAQRPRELEHNEKACRLKDQMKSYKQKCLEEIGRVALDKPGFLSRARQRGFLHRSN